MRYPLTLCSHGRLVIADRSWFEGPRSIGNFDAANSILRINVNRLGQAGLTWLLDADGHYCQLKWLGLEPSTILQRLRISSRVERYSFSTPRRILIGELVEQTAGLSDAFAEAPNSTDLHALMRTKTPTAPVTRQIMKEYLGE